MRSCDGYYFPVSYSTVPGKFAEDEQICRRMCPATEVDLYSHRNPGEDVSRAVSGTGRRYTEMPNAFSYRKQFNAACNCRVPGQSWADALRQSGDQTSSAAISSSPRSERSSCRSHVRRAGQAGQPEPSTTRRWRDNAPLPPAGGDSSRPPPPKKRSSKTGQAQSAGGRADLLSRALSREPRTAAVRTPTTLFAGTLATTNKPSVQMRFIV